MEEAREGRGWAGMSGGVPAGGAGRMGFAHTAKIELSKEWNVKEVVSLFRGLRA